MSPSLQSSACCTNPLNIHTSLSVTLTCVHACMYACVHIFVSTRLHACRFIMRVYLNAILIHIVKLFLLLPDQRPQRTASIQLRPRHRAHRRTWTCTGCKCPLRRVLHSKHISIKQNLEKGFRMPWPSQLGRTRNTDKINLCDWTLALEPKDASSKHTVGGCAIPSGVLSFEF